MLLAQSCSVTLIHSPKTVCIHGEDNSAYVSGSHLKDNKMDGSADGNTPTVTLPVGQ